jgi:hypothetical protein
MSASASRETAAMTERSPGAAVCAAPGDDHAVPHSARCPYARLGLDAIATAGCPGFTPEALGFPGPPGEALDGGLSCAHSVVARESGRHWPLCGHPDGPFGRAGVPAATRR